MTGGGHSDDDELEIACWVGADRGPGGGLQVFRADLAGGVAELVLGDLGF